MSRIPRRSAVGPLGRRSALGLIGLGAAAGVTSAVAEALPGARSRMAGRAVAAPAPERGGAAAGSPARDLVPAENALPGTAGWAPRPGPAVDDHRRQIQGYASRTSVAGGETVAFHVAVSPADRYTVEILRLGHYAGRGARRVASSGSLRGVPRPVPPAAGRTGLLRCRWPVSWEWEVPAGCLSGAYLARFRTAAGWTAYHPFVVRDGRAADFCAVLPTSTYQAYNQWPRDRRHGRSLYFGYDSLGALDHGLRARKVSYDRPYPGVGFPSRFDTDLAAIDFLERSGYDVTYAASEDLHAGRVRPDRYRGLVFLGHDEYWSEVMRDRAAAAVATGVHLAYLTANNVYWNVRFEASPDGVPDRVLTCYKSSVDPHVARGGAATSRWRAGRPGPGRPEQELLGVMYSGIVQGSWPLVVAHHDHWFWADTGVRDGDRIPRVVRGEADSFYPYLGAPEGEHTLLSQSRYLTREGRRRTQHTCLRELPHGPLVFTAATLDWPLVLSTPGHRDRRIVHATRNVFDRMRAT
ncbi:MAG TPA: N,N-dimethylformamidase beta subunit family domain-containing protein [Pilimelia sp.]|nr:N,N-dimethylformamidase beta subunit family domain-containing protein [Pilimelia sp.]